MERKIGEKFELKGKTYITIESLNACDGCIFEDTDYCVLDAIGECLSDCRSDGKSVIFKEVKQNNTNMKHFNLEEAKTGKKVCTRDGHEVRIICFDRVDDELPIVALVKRADGDEVVVFYDANGHYYGISEDDNNKYDLMMASEKETMYISQDREVKKDEREGIREQ